MTDTLPDTLTPVLRAPARSRGAVVASVVALLVPLVILAWMAWSRRWISDDGFINLRIVKQIEAGHGPVFNAGERVEAGTSTLWVALLTVADLVAPLRLEHLAVVLGILGSVLGLALAELGGLRLARALGWSDGLLLPVGALVIAVLPPFWDFATSGLENGLTLAWLGACWLVLVVRVFPPRPADGESPAPCPPLVRFGAPLLVGLGPLVRPDVAVFSLAFLLILGVVERRARWRGIAMVIGLVVVVPAAYEVFRMGYYAAIVPNTALAKEASTARWSQGFTYLGDFVGTYWLWVPVLLAGVALVPLVIAARRRGLDAAMLVIVPVVAGCVHALYVVRVGGDFMHARMLLPSLFVLLLPVMVLAVTVRTAVLCGAVALWAIVCAVALRVPYEDSVGQDGIGDERGFYTSQAVRRNAMTVDDYRGFVLGDMGYRLRTFVDGGGHGLILDAQAAPDDVLPLAKDVRLPVVARMGNIGIAGYAAGTHVFIVDKVGLADPLGGRQELVERGRPGHEKAFSPVWALARFGAPDAPLPAGITRRQLDAARATLRCDGVRDILEAANDRLTPGRFLKNLPASVRLNSLRIPDDPVQAERKLCG